MIEMATRNNGCINIEDYHHKTRFDNNVLLIYIDQWENHSVAKIRTAAQQARNSLKQIFYQKHQDILGLLNEINKEAETNSYNDDKVFNCKEHLNKLREDISDLSKYIHIKHDKEETPIYLIKLYT